MAERVIGQEAKHEFMAEGMTAKVRRRARNVLALVLTLGFAFSVAAGSPLEASALPKRFNTESTYCYWGGVAYSYGAVVVSNGRKYECRNGQWYDIGYAETARYEVDYAVIA